MIENPGYVPQNNLPTQGLDLHRRGIIDIPGAGTTSSSQNTTSVTATATQTDTATTAVPTAPVEPTTIANATTTTVPTNTTTAITSLPTSNTLTSTTLNNTSTTINPSPTNATSTPTETKSDGDSNNKSLVIGGAAVGGLVFAIGVAIIAFRCTLNRRDRQRRNKEMAATLAENFERDPSATPRKGYMELGDGPQTPNSGRGADLSRQGSQDAYFAAHKEGDFYNPHYVQERYGTANAGNYGVYEETELSVIGGSAGRTPAPYGDPSVAYPPPGMTTNHYTGYNDYNGHNGYYGGRGQGF
ncbi:hypothetical protein BGX21_001541 [Mortierella sp. AD011]|nr:hypothetical protein BGX20_005955 [Mortierella sp. AD010]KAF9383605.1 hypothetical protein BGX21_001541 [Mortierella sp. AD011]